MQADAQEKTEEATPRRRQEARRKGTVARSTDLTGALVLLALAIVLPSAFGIAGGGLVEGLNQGLARIPSTLDLPAAARFAWAVTGPAMAGLAMIAGVAMIVGVAVNFVQVGFVLSLQPMNPTYEKIDPLQGMKRLLSARSLFEGGKTVVKGLLFGGIAFHAIYTRWPDILSMGALEPLGAVAVLGSVLQTVLVRVGIAWLALAAVDYLFQRKQTEKQLLMSKQELRQEMKEQEGSPELKAAQSQRRRKLSRGRLADKVKGADVVVVNPTHYALAIQYDRSKMAAPVVVAKGTDYLAVRIRELAAEHRVPIVPNPPLARALYKRCEVGDPVPRELFQAVAEVLAYVYRTVKGVRAGAGR
jgi:flagellar biosynthetic protein FlhB